jgi:hypothetical protein
LDYDRNTILYEITGTENLLTMNDSLILSAVQFDSVLLRGKSVGEGEECESAHLNAGLVICLGLRAGSGNPDAVT